MAPRRSVASLLGWTALSIVAAFLLMGVLFGNNGPEPRIDVRSTFYWGFAAQPVGILKNDGNVPLRNVRFIPWHQIVEQRGGFAGYGEPVKGYQFQVGDIPVGAEVGVMAAGPSYATCDHIEIQAEALIDGQWKSVAVPCEIVAQPFDI